MIPVGNVYYMLAYAFRELREGGHVSLASEPFENSADLSAAILIRAVERLIKRGLGREYAPRHEELSTVRGKIDIGASIESLSAHSRRLVCQYDEFAIDTRFNRILRAALLALLQSGDVAPARRRALRSLVPYFSAASPIDLRRVDWRFCFDRATRVYRMPMFICRLVAEGLLQRENSRDGRLSEFIDDQAMSRLYERFILEYYRAEHPELSATSAKIDWWLDEKCAEPNVSADQLLPEMRTDITLRRGDRTLIIDAKYYSTMTQQRFNKATLHSGNLYQIFTYVKNAQAAAPPDAAPVEGMLLYARTDEEIVPSGLYRMSGNPIEVSTLDLSGDFAAVRAQLDEIIEAHFA